MDRDSLIDCLDKQVKNIYNVQNSKSVLLILLKCYVFVCFKNLTPDFGLTSLQLAEEHAAISMIDAQLEPALLFAW